MAQWWDDVAGTVTRSVGNDWTGERLLDWTGISCNQRYYGTNAHHDVTWLSGTAGTVTASLRYDPFGSARSAVPSGYSPFRFQGSWYDGNSDLSWVVTRWYAPTLGRFVSEDTLLGDPAIPTPATSTPTRRGTPWGRGTRMDDGRSPSPSPSSGVCGALDYLTIMELNLGAVSRTLLTSPAFLRAAEPEQDSALQSEVHALTASGLDLMASVH